MVVVGATNFPESLDKLGLAYSNEFVMYNFCIQGINQTWTI